MSRILGGARAALVVLAVGALAGCATVVAPPVPAPTPQPPRDPGERPNVVLVLTDDLDRSLLRFLPQVGAMQAEGADFSDYSVSDTLCCPSRASILTGRYPHNTGVFTNTPPDGGYDVFTRRGEQRDTFATALQRAGYRTAMMGKYLNGYQPGNGPPPGWDEWSVGGNAYAGFDYDLDQNGRVVSYGDEPQDYLTDVLAARGDEFVRAQAGADQPFLLEIATYTPHGPSTPAPRHADAFPGLTAPRGPAFNEADVADKPAWLRDRAPLGPEQQRRLDADYRKRAQSLLAVDEMLGRLRATLAETGQADNTVVVFSSDNGFHYGQHRLAPGKQTAFDTDVSVPLVVTGPGVAPGTRVPQPVQNVDLAPTFAEIAGLAAPPAADGRSIVPLLLGRPPADWRRAALVEHHGPNLRARDPDRQRRRAGNPPTYTAVRTAAGTYVEYRGGEREYYDRRRDPDQLTNLYPLLPPESRTRLRAAARELATCRGSADCHGVDAGIP